MCKVAEGVVVAANNLVACRIATNLLVAETEANHIDTHIGWRLVRTLAINCLEESVQYRENFDVAIVTRCHCAIGLQVERVNHVDIVQIGRSRLVCNIYGVFEREIPYGECLKLGISGFDVAFVLVVELTQTHRHLATARAGCRNKYQWARCLYIVVFAESLVRVDKGNIVRVTFDSVVVIDLDTLTLQTLTVGVGTCLAVVVGNDYSTHAQANAFELGTQTQHILIVGDAQIAAHLVLLDIQGADYQNHLRLIFQLQEHLQLTVGLKSRQNTACVVVVKQLATELQIELVAKLRNTLFNLLRLYFKILFVIEPLSHINKRFILFNNCCSRLLHLLVKGLS